jgi:hypothetical protein
LTERLKLTGRPTYPLRLLRSYRTGRHGPEHRPQHERPRLRGRAYNRTTSKVDDFLANEAKGTKVIGAHSLEEMVGLLKKPRRVMMLVKAGRAGG